MVHLSFDGCDAFQFGDRIGCYSNYTYFDQEIVRNEEDHESIRKKAKVINEFNK